MEQNTENKQTGNNAPGEAVGVERMVRPEYGSDIYFDVVIKNKSFMGWSAPDVGLGKMKFTHQARGEFTINKHQSLDWMEECWNEFIDFVFNQEA